MNTGVWGCCKGSLRLSDRLQWGFHIKGALAVLLEVLAIFRLRSIEPRIIKNRVLVYAVMSQS